VYWYTAFGHLLASELELPELRPAPAGSPRWTVRVGAACIPPHHADDAVALGRQHLYHDFSAHLFRTATGWRIVVDDTGIYEVTDDGHTITWSAYPDGIPDFGRAHLLGRVLATTMHFSGLIVLHGSAVAFPEGGVAFLAPKHTGKSTLALALTLAGNRLISDDTLPVTLDDPPQVWPGVHSMRLLGDAAEHLTGSLPAEQRTDGKYVVDDLPPERLEQHPRSLTAIYILAAAESIKGGVAVARRPLPPSLAAAALVGQGKVSEMLGPAESPVLLQRAARLAARVPVYQLPVLRDVSRLPEVTAQLAAWHGGLTGTPPRADHLS
jgi:hypothetical protein